MLVGWLLVLYRGAREMMRDGGQVDWEDLAADVPIDTAPLEASVSVPRDLGLFVFGLVAVIGGSELLVGGATALARDMGVSEWVIGVTIVAAGTSAPEAAVSLACVLRGRFDIGAGNLVGSDIFNVLGVLGVAGTIQPVSVHAGARMSLIALPVMVFVLLFFIRTGWRVSRLEGLALLAFASFRWWLDLSSAA